MKRKTVILITGPTASGKTSLSIQLARHLGTSIISADSRQCYKEMNIGVAKPAASELESVKHYFINSHSIHEEVNAATFEQYALNAAENIFRQQDVAVMVGGTGLYIKAFCEGLDIMPGIPAALRQNIIDQYKEKGLEWLQEEVKLKDPLYFEKGEIHNPQRLMRALEVKSFTGKSIKDLQQNKPEERSFDVLKFAIALPKEQLHQHINRRVDGMMEDGLQEEVSGLLPFRKLNALQTVGYNELFSYFDGECSLEEAIERIKTNTRHYAKRQLTWFRRVSGINWISPDFSYELFEKALEAKT